jgi:hypothetical protein
MKIQYRE